MGVVVAALDLGFVQPRADLDAASVVLELGDDPLAGEAPSAEVALVGRAGLDPAVDPVVDMLGEAVGDGPFEA